jgi:type I restriction enzyme S subunit
MTKAVQLGEIIQLRKGKKASEVHDLCVNGAMPYIQIDEVRGFPPQKYASDAKGVFVTPTDLCIVWDGANAGTVGYGVEGLIGSTVARIRLKASDEWDTEFVGRLLQSRFRQLNDEAQARGATIPHVDKSKLEAIELPRINRSEQQRIASILAKADGIRRKRREVCQLSADVLRSSFLQLFGDPANNPYSFDIEAIAKHLSKMRAGTQSGPFGSALKKHEYVEDGVPMWGVDNVQHNEFIAKAKLFITQEKFEQLERYNVLPGDILISRAGTVGRMCIAKPTSSRSIISTNLVRVVLDTDTLLPEYFVALFTYLPHRLGALKANNKDNAFTFLNPKTLKALEIPIPPMELQIKFKRLSEKTANHLVKMNEHLDGLENLFLSLAQRAFRGGL